MADDIYSRTFHNLRISRSQLLNFLFIFLYDIFMKLNIVNFVYVCLKKGWGGEIQTETKLKHFCLLKIIYIFFYNKQSSCLEVLSKRTLFGITWLNYVRTEEGILYHIMCLKFFILHAIFVTEHILFYEFLNNSYNLKFFTS